MPPSTAHSFAPLLTVLQRVQFWLESSSAPQLMVARRTLREFKRQELPPFCRVTPRKIVGPRVPARGRMYAGRMRLKLAQWPEDGLEEAAFPGLFIVVSGQADIRIANYVVHCQPGAMLLVPGSIPKLDSSRPHYENITPEAQCDLMMIHPGWVNGDGLACGLCHSRGARHEPGTKEEACGVKNRLLAQLFAGFADEAQNEGNTKSTFQLLSCILLLLHREIERGGGLKSWRFPIDSTSSQSYDPIEQAMAYMKDHLGGSLSIDSVAHHVGYSRRAFTERFREKTGQSFKAYLTHQRLEHATVLLRNANLSVNKVSSLVGLSPRQLCLLFRQQYQCAPGDLRQQKKCLK